MSFETLLPLIKKTGSDLSPSEFQNIVNVVFHDAEAGHYDAMHADMWESLQQQIDLLAADLPETKREGMRLLDIGSGTGLSTEMLLHSKLGSQISAVTLLDTSRNMLEHAAVRAKAWRKQTITHHGDVSSVHGDYDVIIISSVLHHIPDTEAFLKDVDRLQPSGGILIHLQDPNADYMHDQTFKERVAEYSNLTRGDREESGSVIKSIKKSINRLLGRKTYMDLVNDRLLRLHAIKKRMTSDEIWSVTDIHVENLPFSTGKGISIDRLKTHLVNYTLVNSRSYGFFGPLKSELLPEYKAKEQELIDSGAKNGRNVSAVWIKK